ncbi:DNA repair helicase rad25 [Polychytrium aggregatum]|uniref:DNA repair helicase rad25 n=1 Tax=Polychytrium aggregatum TaxID=110093 RepID=UPI0022FDC920|nr:DNA repair helicase rad25 [Polychytrium aggregatum]KAI9193635.1 DNA repair helicase rad25 [Polychytrium aggregatum]
MPLKQDHHIRPFYIDPRTFHILVEAFSPTSSWALDFISTVAEPVSRLTHIHEYAITKYSLYAAVSNGLSLADILGCLRLFSKEPDLPEGMVDFITLHTESFGRVKLVLKKNRFFLESKDPNVLDTLLRDPVIYGARIHPDALLTRSAADTLSEYSEGEVEPGLPQPPPADRGFFVYEAPKASNHPGVLALADHEHDDVESTDDPYLHSFEIDKGQVENVKLRCSELSYPILEEYDFNAENGPDMPILDIDLKATTKLRPYQETGLSKMFSNGRSRSGIIVLPCGAGKTLVGVTAACTIKRSCLVLCTSSVSVEQWAKEFRHWSTVRDEQIAKFTSSYKEQFSTPTGILVSTYTMIAFSGKRAYDAAKIMSFIQSHEWGFILLDEVHVVPAEIFRKVLTIVPAHTKLGLTATLVREDNKIENLNYLIGPKLYEANWMDLESNGFIARVQCAEVWCKMTTAFYREYLNAKSRTRQLLYCVHPYKIQMCQYLIRYHESRGDKTIIFSDSIFALKHYANCLNRPFICGSTSPAERMRILQQFQYDSTVNTIFLSKVGDTSINIPEASCLIQISSQYGSRRQEAQRLGRILRAKASNQRFNAFFYTLVTQDTEEMYYARKRQQFLMDQGYQFKIITRIDGLDTMEGFPYQRLESQLDLLETVLAAAGTDTDDDMVPEDYLALGQEDELTAGGGGGGSGETEAVFWRRSANLSSLSGADKMAYIEYRT